MYSFKNLSICALGPCSGASFLLIPYARQPAKLQQLQQMQPPARNIGRHCLPMPGEAARAVAVAGTERARRHDMLCQHVGGHLSGSHGRVTVRQSRSGHRGPSQAEISVLPGCSIAVRRCGRSWTATAQGAWAAGSSARPSRSWCAFARASPLSLLRTRECAQR